ncbi:hypothetical protein HK101_003043 [Irineochytrium annulatum]|nr:hypothetical protein HK101_003043 [Irineochytrium annulatum]
MQGGRLPPEPVVEQERPDREPTEDEAPQVVLGKNVTVQEASNLLGRNVGDTSVAPGTNSNNDHAVGAPADDAAGDAAAVKSEGCAKGGAKAIAELGKKTAKRKRAVGLVGQGKEDAEEEAPIAAAPGDGKDGDGKKKKKEKKKKAEAGKGVLSFDVE